MSVGAEGGALDPALVAILVCPATRTPLRHDVERSELVSDEAGLAYPIRDGVPVLLIEEARRIDSAG
jgi:uncharacterized protein YbaR (Trm112 family)